MLHGHPFLITLRVFLCWMRFVIDSRRSTVPSSSNPFSTTISRIERPVAAASLPTSSPARCPMWSLMGGLSIWLPGRGRGGGFAGYPGSSWQPSCVGADGCRACCTSRVRRPGAWPVLWNSLRESTSHSRLLEKASAALSKQDPTRPIGCRIPSRPHSLVNAVAV